MKMDLLPTLPGDVIRLIIRSAHLDIDTRLELRVKPGRLTNDPSYETIRDQLKSIHTRRVRFWERNKEAEKAGMYCALESIRSSDVITGPLRSVHIAVEVWGPTCESDEVRMSIEAIEIVDDDPNDPLTYLLPPGGGEAFRLRGTYCILPTGEVCKSFSIFDEDDDFDDELF